ncbi:putative NAD dependent epimerase/dehydratase [Sarocladium strictum]
MAPKTVLVTGANGYIGNAVARAFTREGWTTYGLIRTSSSAQSLKLDEIIPVIGSIDSPDQHGAILSQLPADFKIDAIISTTEVVTDYIPHYNNILDLLRSIAEKVIKNGHPRPTLIFTSGCKDYGLKPHVHGTPNMTPHTEDSPVDAPALLRNRSIYSSKVLQLTDLFVPVLVRPTNVYGRTSSYFYGFFDGAKKAREASEPLIVPVDGNFVVHSLHVDDCGEAYVAIASHEKREEIEGQVFNMSAHRYETVDEVMLALVQEYGITNKSGSAVQHVAPEELPDGSPWPPLLIDFPQWIDSSKLRHLTGWTDKRPLFSEGLKTYRMSYDATQVSAESGDELTKRMYERMQELTTAVKKQ